MKYNLKIKELKVAKKLGDLSDFVVQVLWEYEAERDGKKCSRYGTASFDSAGDSFIPLQDLTESTVAGWVEASTDFSVLDASLDQQLEDLINPTVFVAPLPWSGQQD
jgi:hypothetical protein